MIIAFNGLDGNIFYINTSRIVCFYEHSTKFTKIELSNGKHIVTKESVKDVYKKVAQSTA